ncbi:unnamed protein product (macronuclear) [Paramecium tetraurelia]|uniref:non-specific serine/threonine protein kinase n=1 Tax=Paramecium tetraurelia TaxID=5888 RepID=Q966Z3_PARTE|nr:uncharacterized protein GSPATT00003425001 [Paramecium tetraurelia]CAC38008.2 casein kinase 2 alpha subunit 1-2 [Paramecium tetraurelia]CAI64581.1 casein kinase 2 alpha subunit 1-2 [Paramecium tetraurelia]CAK90564.1 unnamed protein product [Paramecium tetraurelia]|eukprot:XP_001457961.1 hypothetical protein (macronuclear) [Paramecium tetraurelia strain d4-2]
MNQILQIPPKYYANYNKSQPKEYWDYDNFENEWGDSDQYEVIRKIGRGKYSDVYEGIKYPQGTRVVIKVLKPVKKQKIKRETKILLTIRGHPNVIELSDIVRDPSSKTPCLIFDYIDHVDFRSLFPKLTDIDIRFYLFELIKALDYCHSKGIMHRDVKPQNIIVDPKKKLLKLLDFGLAEYYHPGQDYNVRVASRYFKGPELLVDNVYYDYSLDIWSTGAMMASMIFKKEPFFQGQDNYDQLVVISKVLGTEELQAYIKKYRIRLDPVLESKLGNYPKKEWVKFINAENKHLCSDEAIDILSRMLVYDHALRITPKDAMDHPYFLPVKGK